MTVSAFQVGQRLVVALGLAPLALDHDGIEKAARKPGESAVEAQGAEAGVGSSES